MTSLIKALIIIDMQNEYFPGGKLELVGIEDAAMNAQKILHFFRDKALPVFYVQHISPQKEAPIFRSGTDGIEINDTVAPLKSEMIITKNYPNSFRETLLLQELQSRHIQNIVICGAMSHLCIDTTVRAAFDLGFSTAVAADGCATRDLNFAGTVIPALQVHHAFMAALQWGFAHVKTTNEIILDLQSYK